MSLQRVLLAVLLGFTAGLAGVASTGALAAGDIRIEFAAEVAEVHDPGGLLGGGIQEGEILTGSYTYLSTAVDGNALPTVGDYWHFAAPYGIEVHGNGLDFRTDPDNVEFLVEIVDNHGQPASDAYLLRSYSNLPLPWGPTVEHIAWQLDDPTCAALSSDSLPADAPHLPDWQSLFGLTLEGRENTRDYFVRAHVFAAASHVEEGFGSSARPAAVRITASPNPSAGNTTIRFLSPRNGLASLSIFDPAGRRVRTLAEGGLPPGPVEVLWDGLDEAGKPVRSGVYYCLMEGAGMTGRGRLAVVR